MKKVNVQNNLTLHKKYDLCELIQSRYDESSNSLNPKVDDYNMVTISNPRAGGSITLEKGQNFISTKLLSFKGKTLYLWDRFPIPAQAAFAASKKVSARYRDIYIEFS